MSNKFNIYGYTDKELLAWQKTSRTHEECAGCQFEYDMPAPCPGHVSGPTPCAFKHRYETCGDCDGTGDVHRADGEFVGSCEIAYYEDGIPVSHEGKYIFPEAKDLPKTHFPTDDGWFLVRDGKHLPDEGEEILFVKDVRGTQDEDIRNSLAAMKIGEKHPDQKVIHGWVMEVGFSEELGDHWILACQLFSPNGSPIGTVSADHITYWRPLQEPPKDTYVKSPYNYHQIFEIVQKASAKLSGEQDEE